MSGFTAAGITKDTVTTTQQAPLGFRLTVPDGDNGLQTWVYVKANGAISKGALVAQATTAPYVVDEAGANLEAVKVYGVAQSDIANGSYGFVIARGYCPVILSTSAASPGAADQIKTAANGVAIINNLANEADVAGNLGYMLTAPAQIGGAGPFYGTGMVLCGTGS
jgi:hypothetical protein|tara:strand:- start:48 stop:545 length:498 start_codon:yes stop_codon:yes gene_type:complete